MIKGLYPFGLNHYRSLKFQKLRKFISKNQRKIKVEGAYGSSLSFLLIDIFSSINQQIFYISNSKETASYVYSDIVELIGEKNCSFLPSNYRSDTKKIKDESNIINRSKTIRDILDKETKIIVTYPEAIFEKIPNEKEIDSKTINIEKGQFLKKVVGISFYVEIISACIHKIYLNFIPTLRYVKKVSIFMFKKNSKFSFKLI